jgi:MFS transporter, DHA2 family, multidrug resistance protein
MSNQTLVPEHSLQHKGITLGVMLATIMQALDTTIANVALPHMQGSLSATQDQIAWVLTSYIVASAITIPLVGWLSGYVGRKLIFTISIVGFTLSSVLCGVAETLPQIILFRVLQGMSGAAFLPLSQAILFDINSKENFGRAMAIWGIGVMVGPILGPALGGWLTENYNWRWVFYINVPFGILAFFLLSSLLPESPTEKKRFDFFGFATLSLAVGSLQIFLDRGTLKDWFGSSEILIEAMICSIAFYLFVIHTMTAKKPFINPHLFKDRNFLVSNVLIFVVGIILFATLALIPPMTQALLNYPAFTTGLIIAPRGIGAMLSMLVVGRIIGHVDTKLIISVGLLLTAFSLYMMTRYSMLMDYWSIVNAGIVQGMGIGLVYVPLSTFGFATLSAELRNEGTALFNLIRNIGSSVGISVVEALLVRNTQIVHASLSENLPVYNISSTMVYAANHIDPSTPLGIAALNGLVTQHSAMIAYVNDFKFMMILTLSVLPLVLLMRTPKNKTHSDEIIVME